MAVQIRNVPTDLHRELKARAALEGMSLSDYLLRELRHALDRPTLDEIRKRFPRRQPVRPHPTRQLRCAPRGRAADCCRRAAILEVLLQTPAARRVNRFIFAALHAPHLIDLEVAQVQRRYVRSAIISPQRGAEALADLVDFPFSRYPHFVLLTCIWQMRHVLTAYDAAYLARAEALDARLVTRECALGRAGTHVRVEVI